MTTFNTVEELMQVLDANPHLLESMRARLLTRELLELPETVARLAERVDQIAERLGQLTERVDQIAERLGQLTERVDQIAERLDQLTERVDRLVEQQEQTNQRIDRLVEQQEQTNQRIDRLVEQQEQTNQRIDRLVEQQEQTNQRMDRFDIQLERLRDDVGVLKGLATDGLAQRVAPVIANAMGLRLAKNLDGGDLSALIAGQDMSGIPQNALESFLLSDLIMETTDKDGQIIYVAVESSFTADDRDTRRAIRNAEYMSRFTGQPARAAIAAVRTDWNIDEQVASGAVYWYRLPDRLLQGI